MSTYDQIMAYYADDEEFQKRAQTRWKYFGQSYLNLLGFVRKYTFLQTKYALSGKMDFLDEDADR